MAHKITESTRFVSEVTIVSGGNGYTSPPTLTFSGGGGSGAAASASIFNGSIVGVEVTDIGSGYTSSPTVTVTGDGTGAQLTAILDYATTGTEEYAEKASLGIKYTLPEFIREDYPDFITFLEKYYEFMESSGNPANVLLNKHFYDLEEFEDNELYKKALELAKDFPQILEIDKKTLYKNIKSIYESKGSERSIKAFFKILYNEDVEVFYPSKYILKPSDGIWQQEKSIKLLLGENDYRPSGLYGKLINIVYYETPNYYTEEDTGYRRPNTLARSLTASAVRANKSAYTNPFKYEIFLDIPASVTSIIGEGSGATATATVTAGVITSVSVTSQGTGYYSAPDIIVTDSTGTGADLVATVSNGKVTEIRVNSGGSGYVSPTLTLDTSNYTSFVVLDGEEHITDNSKGYLSRVLTGVSSGSYSGSDAGFKIGDVFSFSENDNDLSYIRVTAVGTTNVPTAYEIIAPGSGFTSASLTHDITSDTGVTLTITLTTDYLFTYSGKFKDDKGKLSDVNLIQDNYKYQSYSYIIKSSLPQYIWNDVFRQHMHPAGKEVFGDLIIVNDLPLNITFTVDGIELNEFITESLLSATDEILIAMHYYRDFADSSIVSDTFSISIEPYFTDSVLASDACFQDYVDDTYVECQYVGTGGHLIDVGKNISDSAITTDVLERSIGYVRELETTATVSQLLSVAYSKPLPTQTVSVTEVFITSLGFPRSLSDTFSTSVSIVLDAGKNISDSATTSDILGINITKQIYDPIGFSSIPNAEDVFTKQLAWSRTFTETPTVSDSGTITGPQDYIAEDYFLEDYMAGYTYGSF